MFRAIKRYLAIRQYVRLLSQELARRFGQKTFYTIDEVNKAIERGGYTKVFIAYAHAAYCSPQEFKTHYDTLGVKCTFEGLRKIIAKRYLNGRADFDASTLFRKFRGTSSLAGHCQTYESGIGEDYGS